MPHLQRGMDCMESMLVLLASTPRHELGHNKNIPGAAVDGPVACRCAAAAAVGGAGVNLV